MNDLALLDSKQIWSNADAVSEIKKIYAPTLTDGEFKTFVGIGKATNLSPFLKEIWAVKFGNNAAQIFVARDGYRSAIGRNPNYESHIVDAVYENDTFEIDAMNNKYLHKYNLCNRGKLVGAYCLVFMKSSPRPYYVFCTLEEYNLGQSLWKSKPATMIKKVAEAQCIRMALPNVFNATYSEDELPENKTRQHNPNPSLSTESIQGQVIEHENAEDIQHLIDSINNSKTEDELRAAGLIISAANIGSASKAILSPMYRDKMNAIKSMQKVEEVECEESKEFFEGTEGLV